MVARGRLQMMCMCMQTSDGWKGSVCFVVDVILLAFRNFHIYRSYYFLSLSIRELLSVCVCAFSRNSHSTGWIIMTS